MKLNGIIIKNEETEIYTAFVKEYPGILAQGSTIDEVQRKLNRAMDNFITMLQRQNERISFSEPQQYVS